MEALTKYEAGYYAGIFSKDDCCCKICGNLTVQDSICIHCRSAIEARILPAYIAKFPLSYYTETELRKIFNLTPEKIDRFTETGLLKERIFRSEGTSAKRFRIFLVKDNKGFLPPHKLLRNAGNVQEAVRIPYNCKREYGIYDFIEREHCI